MATTIGRVTLEDVNNWDMDGDRISTSTEIQGASILEAKALRQQVLGLANNPDEPFVPVTNTEDSDIDGYYVVESVVVPTMPVSLASFTFPVSITLRRVPHYSLPEAESVVLGATRSNDHNISSAAQYYAYWLAQPPSLQYYFGGAITERVADTGTVTVFHKSSATGAGRSVSQFTTVPADWYDGAAEVEVSRGGSWYPVVGRQLHDGSAHMGWRICNGLLRVTAHATEGFDIAAYDGTDWGAAKQVIVDKTSGIASTFTTFAVLRNSPEEVAIRVGYIGGSQITSNGYVDIRLRRGARVAEFVAEFPNDVDTFGSVGHGTAEAGATITLGGTLVGIRAASDDADGNKYLIVGANTLTANTTNGAITVTSQSTFPFGYGISTGTTTAETPIEMISQYFFPYSERTTIVGR